MIRVSAKEVEALRRAYAQRKRRYVLDKFREAGIEIQENASSGELRLTDCSRNSTTILPRDRGVIVTSPEGRSFRMDMDDEGRLSAITDPAGLRVAMARDKRGRLTLIRRGADNVHRIEYDDDGNLCGILYPDLTCVRLEHRFGGQLVIETDRNGHRRHPVHTASGLLAAIIGPRDDLTRFDHEGLDNSPSSITFASGERQDFAYDAAGRLKEMRVNGDTHASFKIDEESGVAKVHYADGTSTRLRFEEDRLVEASNDMCTAIFAYDAKGHLVRENVDNRCVEYVKNRLGSLVGIKTPHGQTLGFERDREQRIRSLTDWSGRTIEIAYDVHGPVREIRWPNGIATSLDNSRMGLPTSVMVSSSMQRKILLDVAFEYDVCNRLIRERSSKTEKTYRYDGEGRLLKVESARQEECEFFYLDANGNRLKDRPTVSASIS